MRSRRRLRLKHQVDFRDRGHLLLPGRLRELVPTTALAPQEHPATGRNETKEDQRGAIIGLFGMSKHFFPRTSLSDAGFHCLRLAFRGSLKLKGRNLSEVFAKSNHIAVFETFLEVMCGF